MSLEQLQPVRDAWALSMPSSSEHPPPARKLGVRLHAGGAHEWDERPGTDVGVWTSPRLIGLGEKLKQHLRKGASIVCLGQHFLFLDWAEAHFLCNQSVTTGVAVFSVFFWDVAAKEPESNGRKDGSAFARRPGATLADAHTAKVFGRGAGSFLCCCPIC